MADGRLFPFLPEGRRGQVALTNSICERPPGGAATAQPMALPVD